MTHDPQYVYRPLTNITKSYDGTGPRRTPEQIYICTTVEYVPKIWLLNKGALQLLERCPTLADHQDDRLYLRACNAAPEEQGVSTEYVLSM